MKNNKMKSIKDFSKVEEQLVNLNPDEYIKLPHPYEDWVDEPIKELTDDQKNRLEHSLDGMAAIPIPKPKKMNLML